MTRACINGVGSLDVQYKISDNKPKDNNPL
jgi:hypothetical protein